jgi:MoxR-like ATPase
MSRFRLYFQAPLPASAKTMFLEALMKLKNSYFIDGASTTKSGLIDCLFLNEPKFLLIDEIDKMSAKDQAMLLNLMESGIVTETKHNKARTVKINTSIFASSNNVINIIQSITIKILCGRIGPIYL